MNRRALLLGFSLLAAPLFGAKAPPPAETKPTAPTLDEWVIKAGSDDVAERIQALDAIGKMGAAAKPALPVLTELLNDPAFITEGNMRITASRRAAMAIRAVDPTFVVSTDTLMGIAARAKAPAKQIRSGSTRIADCSKQGEALETLEILGPAAQPVIPDLVRIARKPCARGTIRATLRALGEPSPDQIVSILTGLESKDPEVRQATAEYLSGLKLAPEGSVMALGRALNDSSSGVRFAALESLERIHPEGEGRIPLLREFLKDSSADIRERALAVIGGMGPQARHGIPLLKEALADKEPSVRLAAARWLAAANPNDPVLISSLIELAKAVDTDAGLRAAEILRSLNSSDPRIDQVLATYRERERRRRVQEMLAKTTPQEREANSRTLKIGAVKIARGIVRGEPVKPAAWFPVQKEPLHCWTEVSVSTPPATLRHLWYRNGKLEGEYLLEVIDRNDRVWSSRKAPRGRWRVELRTDGVQEPLATTAFTVGDVSGTARPKTSKTKPSN